MLADEFGIVIDKSSELDCELDVLDFLPLSWIDRCHLVDADKY